MMKFFPDFHVKAFENEEERAKASELPVDQRQDMVTNLLVPHRRFDAGRTFLRERYHTPVSGGRHAAGWIGGLLGESRTGKSFLAQYYASQHPPVLEDTGYRIPVAYVEAREDWDRIEFAPQIFHATAASTVPRMTLSSMNSTVTRRLSDLRVQLLIIDDAHFMFQRSRNKAASHAALIQHIANQKTCNILLVGLPSVQSAVEDNVQLLNRGQFPHFALRDFDYGKPGGRGRLKLFLSDVDDRLPFARRSGLHAEEYLEDFIMIAGGSVGKAMNVIVPAAYMAINHGSACITREHLRIAAEDRLPSGASLIPFKKSEATAS